MIDFSLLTRSEQIGRRGEPTPAIFVERRTILKAFSLTGGKDPDEVIRHDPDEWVRAAAAAKPIIDFVFDNLPRVYDLSQTEGGREGAPEAGGVSHAGPDQI